MKWMIYHSKIDIKSDAGKFLSAFFLFLLFVFTGCNNRAAIPKPVEYGRIDIPTYNYSEYQFDRFSLFHSDLAKIHISSSGRSDSELWFDISYPSYNAVIHCTYLPLKKDGLAKALEDNHHLVYSHVSMADGIDQQQYVSEDSNVAGILYQIHGDVATPIQFYVTDSMANFLRGSLYYESRNKRINIDSVAPITEMVRKDVEHLMETLSWTHSIK